MQSNHLLYLHPESKCLAWPDGLAKNYNDQNEACDMLVGPCCCGATHYVGEFALEGFEIRPFPSKAILGNFREYPKLPTPPLILNFLEEIPVAILKSGTEGRRFCRVAIPKNFDQRAVLSEWLAASGYQCMTTELELTIAW